MIDDLQVYEAEAVRLRLMAADGTDDVKVTERGAEQIACLSLVTAWYCVNSLRECGALREFERLCCRGREYVRVGVPAAIWCETATKRTVFSLALSDLYRIDRSFAFQDTL